MNSDFAQTEVDAQRVNLTRFSLFFPEKRQFFIEGADSLRMGVGLLHFGPPPLELFYSRAIGLAGDGTQIPVQVGAKLTGKVSGFDVGVLDVQTDDLGRSPGENFAVGRVRKEVLGRSYIGAIMTNREGGGQRNTILGGDARFTFFKNFNVMGLFARADDTRVDEEPMGHAARRGVALRSSRAGRQLHRRGPGLPRRHRLRPSERAHAGHSRRRSSHGPNAGASGSSKSLRAWCGTTTPAARCARARGRSSWPRRSKRATAWRCRFRTPTIACPGRFRLARVWCCRPRPSSGMPPRATFRSFNGRKVSGSVSVSAGDYYSGTKQTVTLQGDIRQSRYVSFNPSYEVNDVELREGAFRTHLVGLRANVSFSTSLLTSIYAQYNSAGQLAATQVRLNYIFRTIDNVYLVFNDTHFTEGVFEGKANRSLVAKVTYSVSR